MGYNIIYYMHADLWIKQNKTNCFRFRFRFRFRLQSVRVPTTRFSEYVVVSVMNVIIRSIDDVKVVPLVLLDLSVDREILLDVLHSYRLLVNEIDRPFRTVSFRTESICSVNDVQSERNMAACSDPLGSVICYRINFIHLLHKRCDGRGVPSPTSVFHRRTFAVDKQLYTVTIQPT